jgi:hypothetical protein
MGSRLHVKPISQHLLALSWLLLALLAAKIGYDEYQGAKAAGYLAFPAWQSTLFFEALAVVGIALIALVALFANRRLSGLALLVGAAVAGLAGFAVIIFMLNFRGDPTGMLVPVPFLVYSVVGYLVGIKASKSIEATHEVH